MDLSAANSFIAIIVIISSIITFTIASLQIKRIYIHCKNSIDPPDIKQYFIFPNFTLILFGILLPILVIIYNLKGPLFIDEYINLIIQYLLNIHVNLPITYFYVMILFNSAILALARCILKNKEAQKNIRKYEINKLKSSLKYDKMFNDERVYIEKLFISRFNYFLIVFSLFMTAGFANSIITNKSLAFFLGAIVLFFIWLPLYRGYKKLDLSLRIIFSDKKHPSNKLNEILRLEGDPYLYKTSKLMGITIPWICIFILFAIGISIYLGYLELSSNSNIQQYKWF